MTAQETVTDQGRRPRAYAVISLAALLAIAAFAWFGPIGLGNGPRNGHGRQFESI